MLFIVGCLLIVLLLRILQLGLLVFRVLSRESSGVLSVGFDCVLLRFFTEFCESSALLCSVFESCFSLILCEFPSLSSIH